MTLATPPQPILVAYGLQPSSVASAGGTAGRTWRVETTDGCFFVRMRGARTSSPQRIEFDHGLRDHLLAHSFPTAAPLANRDGCRVTWHEGGAYEVYCWVDGQGLQPRFASGARIEVAQTLARFHTIAAQYQGECEATVPQFGHYPAPVVQLPRFDAPQAFAEALSQLHRYAVKDEHRAALIRASEWVAWLFEQYHDSVWSALPRAVIHGDYNAANLLFSDDSRVVGVFDFDWAWRDVRVRDIGEGLFFFGAVRDEATDGGSIWSLTACPRFEDHGMIEFLRAYHMAAPLTAEELQAVPLAMLGRWVACRTEGAMKVPDEQKVTFALADFERPFRWYEDHAAALVDAVAG